MWRWLRHNPEPSTNARLRVILEEYAKNLRNSPTVVGYATSKPEHCGAVLGKVDSHRWLLDVGWQARLGGIFLPLNRWRNKTSGTRSRSSMVRSTQRSSSLSIGTGSPLQESSMRSTRSSGVGRTHSKRSSRTVSGDDSQSAILLSTRTRLYTRKYMSQLWNSILSYLQARTRETEKGTQSQVESGKLGQAPSRSNKVRGSSSAQASARGRAASSQEAVEFDTTRGSQCLVCRDRERSNSFATGTDLP